MLIKALHRTERPRWLIVIPRYMHKKKEVTDSTPPKEKHCDD
jgi:hypothetical protein